MDTHRPTTVGIIGLGASGRQLAKNMARRYQVIAFDPMMQAEGKIRNNITWTPLPNELVRATHIIIAEPYSRRHTGFSYKTRANDLAWAASIVGAAVAEKTSVTIIVACVVPAVGLTKQIFGKFLKKGHRIGVAPQLPRISGTDDGLNLLPKLLGGLDLASVQCTRALYKPVVGSRNLVSLSRVERVERYKEHMTLMSEIRNELVMTQKRIAVINNWMTASTLATRDRNDRSLPLTVAEGLSHGKAKSGPKRKRSREDSVCDEGNSASTEDIVKASSSGAAKCSKEGEPSSKGTGDCVKQVSGDELLVVIGDSSNGEERFHRSSGEAFNQGYPTRKQAC